MEMSFQLSAFSFQLVAFSCWLLALGFWRGGGLQPNAARFSQTWDFCIKWWGGPPRPRGTPPSRRSAEESSPSITQQAGQGAGRGRGRPPHYLCRCAFVGKPCGIGLPSAVVFTAETQRCRGRYSKATRVTSALSEPFLAFLSASLRLCGEKELESSL